MYNKPQETSVKGGLTAFFSLHDFIYGVQYKMYSWFFFF